MRSRIALVPIAAFVALLSGCGLVRNLTATIPATPSVAFRVISPTKEHQARFYNVPAQNVVFRTQSDVDNFLATLPIRARDGQGNPVPETLPPIDFSQEQGVLVLFGPQSHGGYSGEISAFEEQPSRFLVHPVRLLPSDEGGYLQAIVYPYQYIAIPRSEKPVEFAATVDRTSPGPWWSFF